MASALANSSVGQPIPPQQPARKIHTDSWILSGVFGLLLFCPLAFGAVEPWSIFVLEASSALLLGLWFWRQRSAEQFVIRDNPLFGPMAAFAVLTLVQLVFGWTAYRHDTWTQALLYVAYASLAFLATQTLRRSSQAKTLAIIISTYGFALASFSLLQGLSPNGKIYWIRTPRFGGWIYGPYVNHNHYAGLMEMLVPIPLVYCLSRYARGRVRSLAAGGAAVMAATIFLSGSRGGMLAFIVELIVLGVLVVKMQRGAKIAAGMGVFAVLIVFLLIWIGGVELSQRVASIASGKNELSGGLRWNVDQDGLRMFAKKPVLGWGLGTFPTAYPQFRTFYTNFFINEAHNDYLQLLVETGVVGFVIMLWFLINLFRRAIKKLEDWPNDINGALTVACLLGCTGILVHSFVDFNLQIPANAALFFVLCTLAASPYALESRQRVRRLRSSQVMEPEVEETPANADPASQPK